MQNKELIRAMVRGVYDLQKIRVQMGNRIAINFRKKLGHVEGEKTEDMEVDAKEILKRLKLEFKKLTDGIVKTKDIVFSSEGIISSETELCLVRHYQTIEEAEKQQFKDLEKLLLTSSIYPYLMTVRGIGPAIAGVIISELDPHKAKYSSSFLRYAGIDVAPDGKARSRRQEHLIKRKYLNSEGEECEKLGVTYNPWLRTKLLGVLAPNFIKLNNEKYRTIYNNYKNRLEHHVDHKEKTKKHRHNMALRYMIKIFLIDLYAEWRAKEGLVVHPPYAEAKLGLKHAVNG